MDYSIKPEEHEVREAREKVENVINSYDYALDIDSVKVNLGWQDQDRDISVIPGENNTITVILNPEKQAENLDKAVLRGLLELEFFEKARFDEAMFNWQEVLKFAYVKNRVGELLGEERTVNEDLEDKWGDLKQELGKRTDDFSEEFYMNAATLGESIGQKLMEKHSVDELPELNRSDVKKAGDELFG